MKRYKLKITYFILSLLPFLASCTDENILQKSSVTEGVPTIVDHKCRYGSQYGKNTFRLTGK